MTVTINVREYRREIQNEQSRETGKKWYTRQKKQKNNKQAKTKAQHNMWWDQHHRAAQRVPTL
jgi:lipid II:glycine glycyltransferase (peptidoglycan interpeptide bridge formation enzyme)